MGKKQTRIKDIAKRAGVSTGTVDRVIHNRGEVSAPTREKILGIINEMDYQPNLIASTLASQKEYRFAVVIPSAGDHNPYWHAPLKGIQRAGEELKPYGVILDIYPFDNANTLDFREKTEKLFTSPPDAVLLAPVFYKESQRFLSNCEKNEIPLVFIDTQVDYPRAIQFIGQNSCQSGHVAARLLGTGQPAQASYLVFNIFGEKDQLYHFTERVEGFTNFFHSRNLPVQIQSFDIDSHITEKITQMLLLKKEQGDIPNGIFVSGSKVYRVARVLEQLGLSHIGLVGYDLVDQNLEFLEKEVINFLISQQPEEQGYLGIQTLYSVLVQNQTVEPVKYTPIDIISRENLAHYLNCQ